ncbi:MAG: glycosyltransferase, partial [Promethearchaeota archaeon]
PVEGKPFDVLIFSRLNPGKQFSQAMKVFSQILSGKPDAQFAVAGAIRSEDKGFLQSLRDIARRHSIEKNVSFVPNPSLSDLKRLYGDSKLLAFLPRNEPLGLVVVEAICAGVPVVGYNSGGILETVIDGKTGFHCEDTPSLVSKTLDLLATPRNIQKLRVNGTEGIERFTERAFLENLHEIIVE